MWEVTKVDDWVRHAHILTSKTLWKKYVENHWRVTSQFHIKNKPVIKYIKERHKQGINKSGNYPYKIHCINFYNIWLDFCARNIHCPRRVTGLRNSNSGRTKWNIFPMLAGGRFPLPGRRLRPSALVMIY